MSVTSSAWIACSISLRAPSRRMAVNGSDEKNPFGRLLRYRLSAMDGSGSWVMVVSDMWHIPVSAEN